MNRKITYLIVAFLLFLPVTIHAVPALLDDFNQHQWENPDWGFGDWSKQAILSWTNAHGEDCMQAVSTCTVNRVLFLRGRTFQDEDWNNVQYVKARVWLECDSPNTSMTLELKDRPDAIITSPNAANISTNTWTDVVWPVTPGATKVTHINIKCESLGSFESTYYFDNIRLVKADGTTWYWDDFNKQARSPWYGGSYVNWNPDNPGVVSHLASTSTINSGAALMVWGYNSVNSYSELQITGLNEDWHNYNMIRADVWVSTAAIPVKFYLWFGTRGDGQNTDYKYVASSCTWQTLYWNLPSYTTYWNVTECKPGVDWVDLYPGGTFYIDNITIGNINVTGIVKSTDVAIARPGEVVTVTLAYGNSGDMAAPNMILTEVVPFNTYLSEQPTVGSADSIEYYVGSSWTGSYDAAATKLRWRDSSVPPGNFTVSYKLKIK